MPLALTSLLSVAAVAADAGSTPRTFGFSGLEIFKVDDGTGRLNCVDVNGDGLIDVAVANNRRATIDFFLQKTPQEIAASASEALEYDNINEIASDARFRKESVLTEKRVFDLVVEDMGGDGRPDLVFYGDPKELVIVNRTESGWSETRQRFPIGDARPSSQGLAVGDLNGDGRKDVVLLGTEKTYLFFQGESGKLAEPVELPNSEKTITGLATADLDGDGKLDLVLVGAGLVEPFRVRFQGPNGLGPEVGIETPAFRVYLIADVTGDGRPEISVVQEATERLVVFQLESAAPEGTVGLGKMRVFPLAQGGEGGQRIIFADVDGDGLVDILELVAKSAQLRVYRQGPGGNILSPVSFPTLAALTNAAAGDIDGNGKPEIIVTSAEEKSLGVTAWDGGRLAFPKSLPLEGKPVGCDLADLDGAGGQELAVAVEDGGKAKILFFGAGSPLTAFAETVEIQDIKDAPERILFFDANQDGVPDLFVFFPYEPLRLYLGTRVEGKKLPSFEDVTGGRDFGRGLLQGAVPSSFAGGDIDGDGKAEFLLAKKNFARAFRVSPAKVLEVVDQFNSRDPNSTILGAAVADWTPDAGVEVSLLDKANSRIWFLGRKAGGPFDVVGEVKVPSFSYRGMRALDLTGNSKPDLFVEGEDRFGILYAGGTDYRLKRIAQYESELKSARLDEFAVGDLNSDGRKDVLVTDLSEDLLEVLTHSDGEESLGRRLRFKVFEDPSRGGGGDERRGIRQFRELSIADVTGDGKPDVVMLIHDRMIVYPQE